MVEIERQKHVAKVHYVHSDGEVHAVRFAGWTERDAVALAWQRIKSAIKSGEWLSFRVEMEDAQWRPC